MSDRALGPAPLATPPLAPGPYGAWDRRPHGRWSRVECRRSTPGPTSRGARETHGMPERVRGGAGAVKKRKRREEDRTW